MQKELELLQPQLVVAAAENEKMLVVIERESKDVETKSEKVRGEEALANEQAAASQELKEECEADLAEAIPALNAALAALDTLKVTTAGIMAAIYCGSFSTLVYNIGIREKQVSSRLNMCLGKWGMATCIGYRSDI